MESDENAPGSAVYQLRVVLHGISPLIWRRLVVPGATTLADLHEILQAAFGWEDTHLHRFTVHGVDYGSTGVVSHTAAVSLAGFALRAGERFTYEYDLFAVWLHDLRVEAVLAAEPSQVYPRCTGGRRDAPPEGAGGPWAFMEAEQRRVPALVRTARIMGYLLDTGPEAHLSDYRDEVEELAELYPLICSWPEPFDRRAVNRRLVALD